LWFQTPIPILPYNGILKFQSEKNLKQRIDWFIHHFKSRRVDFFWLVHPTSPPDLPNQLMERGLQEIEVLPGMTRNLRNLPELPSLPDDIQARKAMGENDVSALYDFSAWRWNVPAEYKGTLANILATLELGKPGSNAHLWQTWRDGQAIAKTGMYVSANSAGIYAVATKPEARGLGLARFLTLSALKEAQSLGKTLAVLHSTPMAQSLYRSLGFEAIADFRVFASVAGHI
ncbi:MAG TPA: GNAT family N-acetyltransferase, partial [Anaerolineales bacterium]|nr:GNAT family N-acetyltransferase [Anaerolineales bacterium]